MQLDDVLKACDALIDQGIRPTIERVRQALGGGSPNTVSPMLEEWFKRLPGRLAHTSSLKVRVHAGKGGETGDTRTGQPGVLEMPFEVSQAAQHLWEMAQRNADKAHARQTQAARRELELQGESLTVRETELQRREAAFEEARKSLDAALSSSQAARETLEKQLADQAVEAAAQRKTADQEIARLGRQLGEAQTAKEQLRGEHASALASRDKAAQDAEERHTANARRMLLEVDRAREEAKQELLASGKERSARLQTEEKLAQLRAQLEQQTEVLRAAQAQALQDQATAAMRLATETNALDQALSRAQADLAAVGQRLADAQGQHEREVQSHEATRTLLVQAMATSEALTQQLQAQPAPVARSRGGKK